MQFSPNRYKECKLSVSAAVSSMGDHEMEEPAAAESQQNGCTEADHEMEEPVAAEPKQNGCICQ